MRYAARIESLIGATPLVDLSALVDGKARILAKYEACLLYTSDAADEL